MTRLLCPVVAALLAFQTSLALGQVDISWVAPPDGAEEPPIRQGWVEPDHAGPVAGLEDPLIGPGDPALLGAAPPQLDLCEADDGTWIRADSYKALPEPGGFTFIPFLGSDAPANLPLELRLASARIGGADLPLSPTATVTRDQHRFTLDRGAARVIYDVGIDAVEQLFEVDTHGMAGDLVLSLDVTTDLEGVPFGGGVRFGQPGAAAAQGVDYGQAHAVDPAGALFPLPTVWTGQGIEITLPASLVEAANGQVVIDPVISTYYVAAFEVNKSDLDMTYDIVTDSFIYVWSQRFSQGDNDVYVRRVYLDGSLGFGTYMDASSADYRSPSAASLARVGRGLVVATRRGPTYLGQTMMEIRGRILDFASGTWVGRDFVIGDVRGSGPTRWRNHRPQVGGSSALGESAVFCVVWDRDFDGGAGWNEHHVRFRTVSASGTLGLLRGVSSTPDRRFTAPAISKSTGRPSSASRWNMCFNMLIFGTSRHVVGVQLNPDGTFATAMNVLHNLPSGFIGPELAISDPLSLRGLEPSYLVAFRDYATTDAVRGVVCRSNAPLSTFLVPQMEHALRSSSQIYSLSSSLAVSTTASDFVLSQAHRRAGGSTVVHVATSFDLATDTELAVSERRAMLAETTGWGHLGQVCLASRFSGGRYSSRYVGAGWVREVSFSEDAVEGGLFYASATTSPAVQYCEGDVNSTGEKGFLRFSGDASVGSNKWAVGTSLPTFQFAMLYGALTTGYTPVTDRGVLCLGGTLGEFRSQIGLTDGNGLKLTVVDPMTLPLGGGTLAAYPGLTCHFQLWHRDTTASGRNVSNYTNAVTLTFD